MASPENDNGAGDDENWGTAPDTTAQETINEEPAAEVPVAPPKIAFKTTPCIPVLSHLEGQLVSIGALKPHESPQCMVHLGVLNENREVSLSLTARFPTSASPSGDQFQRMWLNFYGDAFEDVDKDFVITPVNELHEIADPLRNHLTVFQLVGTELHKLQLTYKPEKVVTKGKDNPDAFNLAASSFPAALFRGLVGRDEATTLSLYFRAKPAHVEALYTLKERLRNEKDFRPFEEYRDKNGQIKIQFAGSGCGREVDVRSHLIRQLNFRSPERYATTLAYGEMREHDYVIDLVRSTLTTPITISFVKIPGCIEDKGFPTEYIGFADLPDTESIGQLFQMGTAVTLCFEQPMLTVEPKGWQCVVKPEIPNIFHPGSIVLSITRPVGDEKPIDIAPFPSPDMRAASDYSVWLFPQGGELSVKRLVAGANKLIHPEPEENAEHRSKREYLQQFCAGLEFSSIPPPRTNLFDKSRLTVEQREKLAELEAQCSESQRVALEEIYSCRSFYNMIQGPPGTGKTTFGALLLSIFEIFGLNANCYTTSNAACDVFVKKTDDKLRAIRFHGVSMEYAGFADGPRTSAAAPSTSAAAPSTSAAAPSTSAAAPSDLHAALIALAADPAMSATVPPNLLAELIAFGENLLPGNHEVAWMEFAERFMPSEVWNKTIISERPTYGSHSLWTRAREDAGFTDQDGQPSISLPDNVTEERMKLARQYYRLDARAEKRPEKANVADAEAQDNDDQAVQEVSDTESQELSFREMVMQLFADTLQKAKFVFTTCSNAADEMLRTNTNPVIVIVDEAGVTKETEALLTILYNLGSLEMVIFLGDHNQLDPTVLSRHAKLVPGDQTSLPYNIFGAQLSTSLMDRQIDNGMRYTMFTKQYRMTAGLEVLSSNMCYAGRLENDVSTLLVNRPKAQQVNSFIQQLFGVTTQVPHLFLDVSGGVCLRGHTMSRKNPMNVIVDLFVIESVLNAKPKLFDGKDICVITPYKQQASMIRQALWRSGNDVSLRDKGVRDVKVGTVDSMQGNEAPMIILDMVLAKMRKGRYGFVTNKGRLNVSVSRAVFFQVVVGDSAAAPAKPDASAATDTTKDDVEDDVVEDAVDAALATDAKNLETQTTMKPLRQLYDFYKAQGVVVDQSHEDLPQSAYVDLTEANAFAAVQMAESACKKCGGQDHLAKDCVQCNRCRAMGHKAAACPNPRMPTCKECGKEGHKRAECPETICFKCKVKGHTMPNCTGPERRTCVICKEVGHQPNTCPYNKFHRDYSDRTQVNLEANKPVHKSTPAQGTTAAAEVGDTAAAETGDTAAAEIGDTAAAETGDTAAAETGDTAAAEGSTGAASGGETGDAGGDFGEMYDNEPAPEPGRQFAAW